MRISSFKLMSGPYFCLLLLFGFGLFQGCGEAPDYSLSHESFDSQPSKSVRFAVAADPQLFRGKKEDLTRAIGMINRLNPDFLVMCGDLVETPGNLKQIQAYKDAVSQLSPDIPLYNLAGNHDLGRPVRSENVAIYQRHFGPLWYYFEYGNNLFIALSSDILTGPDAPLHEQQKSWLVNLLESPRSKNRENIFVFMHHPLYLNSPDEPGAYSNMPVPARKDLLKLFLGHDVRAVFSGHYHDNKENRYQGLDLITTNSITAPLGKIPAGLRVVDVTQDDYKQVYYTTEELAQELETLSRE